MCKISGKKIHSPPFCKRSENAVPQLSSTHCTSTAADSFPTAAHPLHVPESCDRSSEGTKMMMIFFSHRNVTFADPLVQHEAR